MASLSGIVTSFVAILCCTDPFCAAEENSRERISVPESEHFCAKVMSGHFERIQLVTINQDMILEPSYRVLHVSGLNENHTMTLNDTSDREVFDQIYIASLTFVKDWFRNEMDKPIKRLYPLEFGFDRFKAAAKAGYKWAMISAVKKVKLIYVAFTDSAQYTLKVWPSYLPKGKDVELLSKQPISSANPEYALLYKYKDENSVTGYAIQKDSQTGNFIIYDFSYNGKPAPKGFWGRIYTQIKDIFTDSKLVKPEDLKLDSKVYYFMEKTDNPHEIRLVHGYHTDANGSSADRQLFRDALPNGFQYNGSQYLFDGSLGCVYVIQDFEFSLTQQFKAGKVDFRLKRLNIPYEQYFKCPDEYKLADDFAKRYRADRCDSVIGYHDDGSIDRGSPVEHSKSTGLNWTLIGLVCLLFMAALVVLVVVFWKKTNKTRKIDKKKRPIGPNDLESASKSNKTLTISGTKSKKSSSSGSSSATL